MKTDLVNNFIVKIGQNAQENWNLLNKAKQTHWFFHLSSFSSCYVIWECEEEKPEAKFLEEVARICVNNTKHKNSKNIKVDFMRCKNVKKGDTIGEVYYVSNRKVRVIKL